MLLQVLIRLEYNSMFFTSGIRGLKLSGHYLLCATLLAKKKIKNIFGVIHIIMNKRFVLGYFDGTVLMWGSSVFV